MPRSNYLNSNHSIHNSTKIHPGNFSYKPHHPHHQLLIDQFGVKRSSVVSDDSAVGALPQGTRPGRPASIASRSSSSASGIPDFGLDSCTCPQCYKEVVPRIDYHPTLKTHVCAGTFFLLHLVPCFFWPYAFGWFCQRVRRCPECLFKFEGFVPNPKKPRSKQTSYEILETIEKQKQNK